MRVTATQVYTYRGMSVCMCVSVTTVRPAKTAEPIKMWFEMLTRVGPKI